MAKDCRKFWNPFSKTLARENIRAIQLKNLRKLVEYSQTNSTLYQDTLKDINPEDIRTIEDVKQIPLLEKEDLRLAQEDKSNFLFGDVLGVPPERVAYFRQTSGTTGKPVYVPESLESWSWRTEIWCHILWMAGFRDTDRVFIPFEKLACELNDLGQGIPFVEKNVQNFLNTVFILKFGISDIAEIDAA